MLNFKTLHEFETSVDSVIGKSHHIQHLHIKIDKILYGMNHLLKRIDKQDTSIKELKSDYKINHLAQKQMNHKFDLALTEQNKAIKKVRSENKKTHIIQEQMNHKMDLMLEGLSTSLEESNIHKQKIDTLEEKTQILNSNLMAHLRDKKLHLIKK